MRTRILIALLASMALLVAGCGSRLSSEQRAEVEARFASGGGGSLAAGGPATSIVGGTEGTEGIEGSSGSSGGGSTGGGTSSGGGEGTTGGGGGGGGGGSTCSGGGATDTGVTETEIRIGNVSTISGPIQGFGQTGVNAVKAYLNMVNANGGVCGRELVLVTADDRLDSGVNKSKTEELAENPRARSARLRVVERVEDLAS